MKLETGQSRTSLEMSLQQLSKSSRDAIEGSIWTWFQHLLPLSWNQLLTTLSDIDDPNLPEAFANANISVISMDDIAMGNEFPNGGEFTV